MKVYTALHKLSRVDFLGYFAAFFDTKLLEIKNSKHMY